MRVQTYVIVGVVWLLSLVVVAAWAAQSFEYRKLPEPRILTGEDVGFRVEGLYGNTPTGSIVVRVNGQWVPVRGTPGRPGLGTQ